MKAFPNSVEQLTYDRAGMDLRDYFAAKAMQAIVSKIPVNHYDITSTPTVYAEVANGAYAYADAMMVARKKEGAS